MRQRSEQADRVRAGDKVQLHGANAAEVTIVGIDRGYLVVRYADGRIGYLLRSEIVEPPLRSS